MQSQLSKLRHGQFRIHESIFMRIMIMRVSYPVSSKSIWKNSELQLQRFLS
tara:strand:+ start:441 stop:593 length:153 start_codon:yes stop_codon:yes gene_type:complete